MTYRVLQAPGFACLSSVTASFTLAFPLFSEWVKLMSVPMPLCWLLLLSGLLFLLFFSRLGPCHGLKCQLLRVPQPPVKPKQSPTLFLIISFHIIFFSMFSFLYSTYCHLTLLFICELHERKQDTSAIPRTAPGIQILNTLLNQCHGHHRRVVQIVSFVCFKWLRGAVVKSWRTHEPQFSRVPNRTDPGRSLDKNTTLLFFLVIYWFVSPHFDMNE